MATAPFRLSTVMVSVLRKISDRLGIGMADWIRDRIKADEIELRTEVQPQEDRPSLIRDLWSHSRSTPEVRQILKEKILESLSENRYELDEVGIDNLAPLHWAARGKNSDVEIVEAVLAKVHDVSPRDYYGNTPLVLAIAEQDRKLETNLPVIQFLLSRSKDKDLLIKPSLFGGNEGIYDYAKSNGMNGTVSLIRDRFQKFNLESSLNETGLSIFDLAARISQVLYYQGKPWTVIAAEMNQRGYERSLVWYHLNRLGAWTSFLEERKIAGESDSVCASTLRDLGATWADIAWAYVRNGYPSGEIVQILYPLLIAETDNKGTLAWMIAGSIDPDKSDELKELKSFLISQGEDPQALVKAMPYQPVRKVRILTRMGMEAHEGQNS